MHDFSSEELKRYSRNILLNEVGIEGQEKIMNARVLVIGAGGLGSPALLYLAAAGAGTIGIADYDTVDLTNLQRQIIHTTGEISVLKTDSAREKIRALNPGVKVVAHTDGARPHTIRPLIRDYDFIIDGTDNFASKFLINDACVLENKPFSHGGVLRFWGQTMTVVPHSSACYRCVFHAPPPPDEVPTCAQAGVLGAIAGMLGTIQAAEALKAVIGIGTPLTNRLLTFDALSMEFRTVPVKKNDQCPVCGSSPSITSL
jgi:adenylyltransferase/sulfurtransferase